MLRLTCGAAASLFLLSCPDPARAQAAAEPTALPDIVVTADRVAEPVARSGSAISVVTRDEIRKNSPTSLVDALRDVPGLDISESGGPGATTSVRLRGGNTNQTLVLIDGIRVNDPAAASGDFDFATLLPTGIERIEVLRGPQSALYGSDAIGGVVNIITRSGGGAPHAEGRIEAGSYGTLNSSVSAFGSTGPWSYAFSGGGQKSDGFSRYGYRIGRLESRFPRFEPDGFSRYGGYGRIGYDAGEGVRFEAGLLAFKTISQYDAASGTFPDTPAEASRQLTQLWGRATVEGGPLTHTLQVYVTETDRIFDEITYRTSVIPRNTTTGHSEYHGERYGTEYQGNLALGAFGSFIFGGKVERESADILSNTVTFTTTTRVPRLDQSQLTRAIYGLWQWPIGERLILSIGGRHDEVDEVAFDTWRATAAYLIPETSTKLRASAGTGGKAPTLYQLFSPQYGNPALSSEESFGWDAGIDQTFLDGRARLSATIYGNRFTNLINFDSAALTYFNTARAETSGVEIEGRLVLVPDLLRLTGNYTYLHAKDLATNLTLARRPESTGRVGLSIDVMPRWVVEPRVTFVSERFSNAGETGRLAPYARLDVYTEYRIDDTFRVFARAENVNNARYQEVLNFGTTGPAVYGGLNVTW